ncbi:hypothetical protein D3C81_2126080 [compost metagenome]
MRNVKDGNPPRPADRCPGRQNHHVALSLGGGPVHPAALGHGHSGLLQNQCGAYLRGDLLPLVLAVLQLFDGMEAG